MLVLFSLFKYAIPVKHPSGAVKIVVSGRYESRIGVGLYVTVIFVMRNQDVKIVRFKTDGTKNILYV